MRPGARQEVHVSGTFNVPAIYRTRLGGFFAEGSACGAGAGAMELLFVASPMQSKNGSDSSRRCLEAAPVAWLFGAAPASPVPKRRAAHP